VCGQGIQRCKCGNVNWKYVRLGVGSLKFDIFILVCFLSNQSDQPENFLGRARKFRSDKLCKEVFVMNTLNVLCLSIMYLYFCHSTQHNEGVSPENCTYS
jgi:hypothetical protein